MKIVGCDLKLSTAHHPQTDGLAERAIQTLEDLIRRYCAFGMLYKDNEGFTHDWVSLLPGLEFAYNSTVHSTTGKTPYELERGYIPNPPRLLVNAKLGKLDVHPSSASFSNMQALARSHAEICINQAFAYEKRRWDKSHADPDFKIGDQVLLSTVHFNNLTMSNKLKDPYIGPFTVVRLIGPNALELDLHGAYARRHPVFPVSLVKLYQESDVTKFPQRASKEKPLPEIEEEDGVINKVIQQRIIGKGTKRERQFLVTFKGKSADTARWVAEGEIPNAGVLLRRLRLKERNEIKK